MIYVLYALAMFVLAGTIVATIGIERRRSARRHRLDSIIREGRYVRDALMRYGHLTADPDRLVARGFEWQRRARSGLAREILDDFDSLNTSGNSLEGLGAQIGRQLEVLKRASPNHAWRNIALGPRALKLPSADEKWPKGSGPADS